MSFIPFQDVHVVLDPIQHSKVTKYQEQVNGCFKITVFFAGSSKRHSSHACRANSWITASVRRDDIKATNELNINFSLEENIILKTQFKFFFTI